MTANVITYRERSAVARDRQGAGDPAGRRSTGWRATCAASSTSTRTTRWRRGSREAGFDRRRPRACGSSRGSSREIQDLPRHLGQHSGGMVIAQGAPRRRGAARARHRCPGRVVVQWDKDDCADLGIIKVDLLGLGHDGGARRTRWRCSRAAGVEVDLAHLPPDDPKVYAHAAGRPTPSGLFQVESRAQMATLPRMKPDALLRPRGRGGDHPARARSWGRWSTRTCDRRAGREPVTYAHPSLEPILKRTLGVPLFQEQLLRMAMARGRLHGRRGRGAAPRHGLQALARSAWRDDRGEAARGHGANGHHGRDRGRRSCARSPRSRSTASPSRTRRRFALIAYASAYLQGATTRPPSPARCSTTSPWASTTRSRW